ncbi:hypothetical protein SGPA1_80083 [Streptomyces misionensis JCM 4497]
MCRACRWCRPSGWWRCCGATTVLETWGLRPRWRGGLPRFSRRTWGEVLWEVLGVAGRPWWWGGIGSTEWHTPSKTL